MRKARFDITPTSSDSFLQDSGTVTSLTTQHIAYTNTSKSQIIRLDKQKTHIEKERMARSRGGNGSSKKANTRTKSSDLRTEKQKSGGKKKRKKTYRWRRWGEKGWRWERNEIWLLWRWGRKVCESPNVSVGIKGMKETWERRHSRGCHKNKKKGKNEKTEKWGWNNCKYGFCLWTDFRNLSFIYMEVFVCASWIDLEHWWLANCNCTLLHQSRGVYALPRRG